MYFLIIYQGILTACCVLGEGKYTNYGEEKADFWVPFLHKASVPTGNFLPGSSIPELSNPRLSVRVQTSQVHPPDPANEKKNSLSSPY